MGAREGTIGVRPVPRVRPLVVRLMIVLAAIVVGWAALAAALSLAADRPTDDPAVGQPAGATSWDERKPRGFGGSFTHEEGVRSPTHLPKR